MTTLRQPLTPISFFFFSLALFPIYVWRMALRGDIDEVILWMKEVHLNPAIRATYLQGKHVHDLMIAERKKK